MRAIQPIGPYVDTMDAPSPAGLDLTVRVGMRGGSFQQNVRNALATTIAQYYGIVQDGLPNAVHLFKGLKRPLMHGDDKEADKSVLVYSWRPVFDYVWRGSRFEGNAVAKNPLPNRVFVVLVREEQQPNEYAGIGTILGSIEKWNWVKEDPALEHAPIDWQERYEMKLWSKAT